MTGDFDIEEFKVIRTSFHKKMGQRDYLQEELDKTKTQIKITKQRQDYALRARVIVQKVAQSTQQNLEFHISNLVTMGLAAIFPEPYVFKAEFVQRRGKTECDLFYLPEGEESEDKRLEPMSQIEGGGLDVTNVMLRIAYWTLKKNRASFVLDEPFRNVSLNLRSKCLEMLLMTSEKLKIQFLIVSHMPEINIGADREFQVVKVNRISQVKEVRNES
jgi:DNA repair ATPase RecN